MKKTAAYDYERDAEYVVYSVFRRVGPDVQQFSIPILKGAPRSVIASELWRKLRPAAFGAGKPTRV